jgi:membrane protease YdiL (CAAX protease family)
VFVVVYVQVTGETPTSSLGAAAGEARADWQVIALAVLALAAPFVEELHFRGAWWSALRRRGLGGWPTLLLTAALFAVIHLEPARVALLFAAGLAAGYVRMVTDRLGPAIVAHMLVNGIAVVGLLSLL